MASGRLYTHGPDPVVTAIALLAGVLAGLGAAAPPAAWVLCLAGGAVAGVALSPLRRRPAARALAAALAGFLLVGVTTVRWLGLVLDPADTDARLLVVARVLTVPESAGAELRFDAQVRQWRDGRATGPARRARLRWRDAPVRPRVGERWQLLLRIESPASTRNFAGDTAERLAFRDRIHVHARVLPAALDERLRLADASVDTVRARIALRIADAVSDPDSAALLSALAVGLTGGLTLEQWRVFNVTGTTHLVAISGLHVTLFALVVFVLARALWRRAGLWRLVEREPFALLLGFGAAGAYALLSGFSVPAQRTWLMLGIFVFARLQARSVAASRLFGLALAGVLALDVLAPLAAGFWLSFAAVGVLLAVERGALVRGGRFMGALRLQMAVMLALAPLTFAVFGGVSLVGLAVNLVAIPVVSFVFVPLVLAGAVAAITWPEAGAPVFALAARLYDLAWPALERAADLDLALWRAAPPAGWLLAAAIAGGLCLHRWPWPLRLASASLVLPLVFGPPRLPPPQAARVHVLDVGRGSAVLVATHDHVLLFDTGDAWNTRGSRARQFVLPALAELARERIDLVVLPALDPDRAAGVARLAWERAVASVRVGGGWPGTSLPVSACADDEFTWDGVRFELFTAGSGERYCALRISTPAHRLLIAGDLDARAEQGLVARLPAGALASDVAILGRQASALGSAPRWIEASAARLAIASGGVAHTGSRATAMARWRARGARVLDTHELGGIVLEMPARGPLAVASARVARYPFAWRRSRDARGRPPV